MHSKEQKGRCSFAEVGIDDEVSFGMATDNKIILPISIYLVDLENNRLYLERIAGRTLKDVLWTNMEGNFMAILEVAILSDVHTQHNAFTDRELLLNIAKNVGVAIGKMHDAEIIHGDLTTSNVMVRCAEAVISSDVVIIDYGLGMMKPTMEDKAVDLYVLERAFISTHPGSEFIVSALLESYRFSSRKGTPTLQKLEQV